MVGDSLGVDDVGAAVGEIVGVTVGTVVGESVGEMVKQHVVLQLFRISGSSQRPEALSVAHNKLVNTSGY